MVLLYASNLAESANWIAMGAPGMAKATAPSFIKMMLTMALPPLGLIFVLVGREFHQVKA